MSTTNTSFTDTLTTHLDTFYQSIVNYSTNSVIKIELGLAFSAVIVALLLAHLLRTNIARLQEPHAAATKHTLSWYLGRSGRLVKPLLMLITLGITHLTAHYWIEQSMIITSLQRVVFIWLLWVALKVFVTNPVIRTLGLWIAVPAAILHLLGMFGVVSEYLNQFSFTIGKFDITVYWVIKAIVIACFILWFGKILGLNAERYIRYNTNFSRTTQELVIKLFDITLYAILFLIILNMMGIDLTALTVFGGALGVGLGFGLQKIASNFVSGIILLSEKSININNLIEMDDGVFGYVRKLGARASVVETFDGKEVMVPNEDFITSRVANLTHSSNKGRIDVAVGVSYNTDLKLAYDLILSSATEYESASQETDFEPKCFLSEFADSSVNFRLTFWLDDVTKGRWRAKSDVLFTIWDKFKQHNIEIPFPQRDIHIKQGSLSSDT